MADQAWAVYVTKDNYPAILSEAGRKFDRDFLERWVAQEGEGWFVRDKLSPKLDCCLFSDLEFFQLYMFSNGDADALFRQVTKL